MKNFDGFGLHPALTESLAHMNYTKPTPIQAEAIPLAMQGRDIMGSAQTGTGKTAAFAIPIVNIILNNPDECALILTPTRELGKQIMGIMHQLLGKNSPINTAFLIGGEAMGKQFQQLRQKPRLVVGTPGRINDHLDRRSLSLDKTSMLVLDETDRMLDMGFSVQIDRIVKHMPKERQTLMFSATLPKNILRLSESYMNNPERIAIGSTTDPAKNIRQEVIRLNEDQKPDELISQLYARKGSIIIFVKTKYGTERMAKKLNNQGFSADAIHGDLRQSRREKVIRNFRDEKYRILVATDVAARGLDIPHIAHVINYDLPQVPEDYIHRIGRTARAGAEGDALCLVTPKDGRKWHAIEQLLNPEMKKSAPNDNFKKKKKFKGKKKRFDNADNRQADRFDDNAPSAHDAPEERRYDKKKSYGKKSHGKGQKDFKKKDFKKKDFGKKDFKNKDFRDKDDGDASFDKKSKGKKFGDKKFEDKKFTDNKGGKKEHRKGNFRKKEENGQSENRGERKDANTFRKKEFDKGDYNAGERRFKKPGEKRSMSKRKGANGKPLTRGKPMQGKKFSGKTGGNFKRSDKHGHKSAA